MTKLRKDVLRLYKQIMLISRTWESIDVSQSEIERNYIKTEARKLFKKNKSVCFKHNAFDVLEKGKLSDEAKINKCLDEANARIELALHYRNPYPRPVHVSPAFVAASKDKKAQSRRSEQSKPVYIHSQDK